MRRVNKSALISALSVAAFSGCEKRIAPANIDTVNRMQAAAERNMRGLTPKEVESVLGQPTKVEKFTLTRPAVKEFDGERMIYVQDGKEIVLHFVEGKMVREVPAFGAKEPDTAPNTGAKMPEKKP